MLPILLTLMLWNESVLTLHSNQHSQLFYPRWLSTALETDQGFIVPVLGDPKTGEGMTLYDVRPGSFKQLYTTTPKDGVTGIYKIVGSPKAESLYFLPYSQPFVFKYHVAEQQFKRHAQLRWSDTLIYYQDQVFHALAYPKVKIEPVLDVPNPFEKIQAAIPETTHPLDRRWNIRTLVTHVQGQRLFVGYSTHHQVFQFDIASSKLEKTIAIARIFPGYQLLPTPEKTPPVDGSKAFYDDYMSSGFVLFRLAHHQGQLFGLFSKGWGEVSTWASIGGERRYSSNEASDQAMVLFVGNQYLLMGKKTESDDGAVQWDIWVTTSWPSSP